MGHEKCTDGDGGVRCRASDAAAIWDRLKKGTTICSESWRPWFLIIVGILFGWNFRATPTLIWIPRRGWPRRVKIRLLPGSQKCYDYLFRKRANLFVEVRFAPQAPAAVC